MWFVVNRAAYGECLRLFLFSINLKTTDMKRTILFLVGVILSISGFAYDFEKDGIYYNITSLQDLTVEVTSGDNLYEGNITIPETVDYSERTFHVIRIGEKAFLSSGITGVELPHSILTVGEYAFSYCWQLNSIKIPSSINSFEHGAFGGCSNLNNVEIEDAETQLSMPWNEWQVNNSSYFNNCNLTSVYYGRNVSYRQGEVYDGLFWNQNNLRNVVIGPFVTILDGDLFKKCQALETIDIPANVKTIGRSTFEDCSSLKDVIFHEGLQEIWSIAFKNCKAIDKLLLPSTLTSIGSEAFVGCTSITKVYSKILEPFDIAESTFAGIAYLNSVLYVPIGTKNLYQEKTGWKDFASIVETDDFDIIVNYYSANITVSKGGRVLCNGISVSNTSMATTIKAEEDLNLLIIPDEGYRLVSLTVGENDVTNMVTDGIYTVKNVEADINIYASFEEIPIALTIQHAENGYLKQFVQRGANIKFALVPAEGWKINSVVYNGYDVTSELNNDNEYTTPAINADAILSVSFESTQSAVSSARISYARVYGYNGEIVISGIERGDAISVYDEGGKIIAQTVANGNEQRIAIPAKGIYIVKTGEKTVKVCL